MESRHKSKVQLKKLDAIKCYFKKKKYPELTPVKAYQLTFL